MKFFKIVSVEKVIFLLTLWYTLLISNLYYISTIGPDFLRYKEYIYYYLEKNDILYGEQGVLYFFIISLFCSYNIRFYLLENTESIIQLGYQENFDTSYISDFEYFISLSIQYGNFVIYTFGLIGLFKLLCTLDIDKSKIYLILSFVNLLPSSIQLRLTLKPEILGFSFLIWVLYFYAKFLKTKNYLNLYLIVPLMSILLTLKASITAMVGILGLIILIRDYKIFVRSYVLIFLVITTALSTTVYIENFNILNRSIFEREDLNNIYNQPGYNNKADLKFFTNINSKDLIYKPYKNFHADSMVGILLLDSFGDYFNEYWNKDYTLFSKDRKEFIKYSEQFKFDSKNKILYQPILNFDVNNLRRVLSMLLSLSFYISLFNLLIKKDKVNKFYLMMPFIGIIILIINSIGIPENNFNPDTGDLFKSFYFSFFIIIAFVFVLLNSLTNNSSINLIIFSIYFTFSIFIFGFPKANNTKLDSTLIELNTSTFACEINKFYLKSTLIEYSEMACLSPRAKVSSMNEINLNSDFKKNSENQNYKFSIKEFPLINLLTLLISFIIIGYDLSIRYLRRYVS